MKYVLIHNAVGYEKTKTIYLIPFIIHMIAVKLFDPGVAGRWDRRSRIGCSCVLVGYSTRTKALLIFGNRGVVSQSMNIHSMGDEAWGKEEGGGRRGRGRGKGKRISWISYENSCFFMNSYMCVCVCACLFVYFFAWERKKERVHICLLIYIYLRV